MWEITKEFKFDAGHRVYSQNLNQTLAGTSKCVCKHLHGHEFKVEVSLSSNSLDTKTQMVTDFKHLTWFKHLLDNVFDHSFILGKDDTFAKYFIDDFIQKHTKYVNAIGILKRNPKDVSIIDLPNDVDFQRIVNILKLYYAIKLIPKTDDDIFDEVGVITLIPYVPTAENLAMMFYNIVNDVFNNLNLRQDNTIYVNYVKVWETSKSYALYKQ